MGGTIREMIADEQGRLVRVDGANPVAGASETLGVTDDKRWRIVAARITLVTDATVANRLVYLSWRTGAGDVGAAPAGVVQAASLTRTYDWFAGAGLMAAAVNNNVTVPLPIGLLLNENWDLQFNAINLQAGDDFGAPTLFVEEWIED